MKEITLTQGKIALIDNEDFEKVSKFKWNANFQHTDWYARSWKNGKRLLMHRFIMGIEDSNILVDHRNHNTLDNQKTNLRIATKAQNCRNKKHRNNTRSIYSGVSWHKASNKWIAKICVNYKNIHLGIFDIEGDAAIAYNMAAIQHFGEFANLNSIK
jgi:hypothetical protein